MVFGPRRARNKETLTAHSLHTHDSAHKLIDMRDDLLKPINQNHTNPNVPNPFVQARHERLRQAEQAAANAATQQGADARSK